MRSLLRWSQIILCWRSIRSFRELIQGRCRNKRVCRSLRRIHQSQMMRIMKRLSRIKLLQCSKILKLTFRNPSQMILQVHSTLLTHHKNHKKHLLQMHLTIIKPINQQMSMMGNSRTSVFRNSPNCLTTQKIQTIQSNNSKELKSTSLNHQAKEVKHMSFLDVLLNSIN